MATVEQSSTLESFPKPFVTAMKTLFNILDDDRTGFVKLTEIEHRWAPDKTDNSKHVQLPCGVIEALREVAPSNGLLSFENFCCGLKIALLQDSTPVKKDIYMNKNAEVDSGKEKGGGESKEVIYDSIASSEQNNYDSSKNFMKSTEDVCMAVNQGYSAKGKAMMKDSKLRHSNQELPAKPLSSNIKSTQPPNMATVRPTTINSNPHHRSSMPTIGEKRVPVYEKFPKYNSYCKLLPGKPSQQPEGIYGKTDRPVSEKLYTSMIEVPNDAGTRNQPIYAESKNNIVAVLKSWQHEKMIESQVQDIPSRGSADGKSTLLENKLGKNKLNYCLFYIILN